MENLMNMFNPETMKNLMDNDEIKKMLNDPNIMGNLKNMMGNNDLFKTMNDACAADSACAEGTCAEGTCSDSVCVDDACADDVCADGVCDINLDNLENIDIEESNLNINDKVTTHNLKNELYNNKHGVIEDILPNGRYVVTFEFDNNKSVAIREENLVNRFDNIENID
jgi:hypothetical protein